MRKWLAALLLLALATPSWSEQRKVTLYLDGAVVEEHLPAHRGHAEVELPAAMQPGSLRVRPVAGTVIKEVDIVPVSPGKNARKDLVRLTERKEWLTDRLKGLDAREDIFLSAAKLQSGKAPRKTKNNPDPLASIRQGTNLALTQLEEVYRQQRVAHTELEEIQKRIDALGKRSGTYGAVGRIAFAGKGKGAVISYIRSDLFWSPRYDFRLEDTGKITITIRPLIPAMKEKAAVTLHLARLADTVPEIPVPAMQLPVVPVRLPVERATYHGGPGSSLTFVLFNTGVSLLPPGEAACYWQGEYLGTIPFAGCRPGDICEIAVGTMPPSSLTASP